MSDHHSINVLRQAIRQLVSNTGYTSCNQTNQHLYIQIIATPRNSCIPERLFVTKARKETKKPLEKR